jgi:hypothetical protein
MVEVGRYILRPLHGSIYSPFGVIVILWYIFYSFRTGFGTLYYEKSGNPVLES